MSRSITKRGSSIRKQQSVGEESDIEIPGKNINLIIILILNNYL
jgi:hypothetical protein